MLVQLLRMAEGLAPEAALFAESAAYAALQGGPEHRRWLDLQQSLPPSPPSLLNISRSGQEITLTINRPWAQNAIDRPLRDALFDGFMLASLDASITSLKLQSVGRAFCTGADLSEFGTAGNGTDAHLIRMRTLPAFALLRRPIEFSVHIQGACVGSGLELAAFASRITASPKAWFELPELSMGIIPGFGGTVSLSRRIGRQKAAWLILTGRRISARVALDLGLVDSIIDALSTDESGAHI